MIPVSLEACQILGKVHFGTAPPYQRRAKACVRPLAHGLHSTRTSGSPVSMSWTCPAKYSRSASAWCCRTPSHITTRTRWPSAPGVAQLLEQRRHGVHLHLVLKPQPRARQVPQTTPPSASGRAGPGGNAWLGGRETPASHHALPAPGTAGHDVLIRQQPGGHLPARRRPRLKPEQVPEPVRPHPPRPFLARLNRPPQRRHDLRGYRAPSGRLMGNSA